MGWTGLFSSMCSVSCSAFTHWPLNSGRYFSTGSSTLTLPSSTSIIKAVAVIGLDWEAIQNSASVRIGFFAAMSMYPTASRLSTRSGDATSVTAPASVWFVHERLQGGGNRLGRFSRRMTRRRRHGDCSKHRKHQANEADASNVS